MIRRMNFVFHKGKYGRINGQSWEGVKWYLNVVEKQDRSHSYLNIYLGGESEPLFGTDPSFVVVLTASVQSPNKRNPNKNKRDLIPENQQFKMKNNEEVYLGMRPLYDTKNGCVYKKLTFTVVFHSIKKYTTEYFQCDLLTDICNYLSTHEEQEVQYVKFPNCEFGNPSFKKSDLVFQIGDFQLFCHSQILSLNSPFFSEVLDENEEENKKKDGKYVLELSDIDNLVDFQSFLYLMYFHRYTPNAKNVENILNYADRFQVDVVKEACEDFLLNRTHSFPIETLVAIAWRFSLKKLKVSLDSRMMDLKFKDIFNSVHYQEASDENKIEMCELSLLKFSLR